MQNLTLCLTLGDLFHYPTEALGRELRVALLEQPEGQHDIRRRAKPTSPDSKAIPDKIQKMNFCGGHANQECPHDGGNCTGSSKSRDRTV